MKKTALLVKMIVVNGLCACLAQTAIAQTFPDRPVQLVVPVSAGSGADLFVRRLAPILSRSLGQPVIVINRPGANGIIAAMSVAKGKPDGLTVLYEGTFLYCIQPLVFPNSSIDTLRDFVPVTLALKSRPVVVVSPHLPVRTLAEFIAYVKARPGEVAFGSPGEGSPQRVTGALLEHIAGIRMSQIPYKNVPQVVTDAVAGHIDATVSYIPAVARHVQEGKLRALVISGDRRSLAMPNVPSAQEAHFGDFDLNFWGGFVVRAGTPPEIVARLNKDFVAAITHPDFVKWAKDRETELLTSTPEEFATHIRSECHRWTKIIEDDKLRTR